MINPNWPRWITASLSNYFAEVATTLNIPLIVDGIDERESTKLGDHVELRINGPFAREPSKGYFILEVGVNLLITDIMGNTENPYKLTTLAGGFQAAVSKPILLHKYGPEPEDDQTYFGCLLYKSIKTFQYGQVSANDRVRQAAVDAQLYLEIEE